MSPSCPISNRRVDTNVVRMISFQVLIFTLLFAVTQMKLFILIVLFDFILRLFRQNDYSPFSRIAERVVSQWNVMPRFTDESPKRFALYLGLFTAFVITIFSLFGLTKSAAIVALILILCSFLEVVFDFCIGCKLYYALQLSKVIKHDRNFN